MKSSSLSFLLVLTAVLGLAACSSSSNGTSDDVEAGTGTGDAVTDAQSATTDALNISSIALSEALTQSGNAATLAKAATLETISGDCTPSGTWTLDGTYDDDVSDNIWSYDFTIAYDACGEVDGELEYSGDYTFSDVEFTYSSVINGVLGGYGCTITYDDFEYSYSFNNTESSYTGILNGSYTSACDSSTVTCTFDDADLFDSSSYASACSTEGDDADGTALELTDEIEAFFSDNSGTHSVIAATREGNSGDAFTDGGSYEVTLDATGTISVTTDGEVFELNFDEHGYYFETSDSETTFIWKDADDQQIIMQDDSGLAFVVGIANGSVLDYWDLTVE